MKHVKEPESFTCDGDDFIIFYGKIKLIFPRELYRDHFEEWKQMHTWFDKSRIEFEILSELS